MNKKLIFSGLGIAILFAIYYFFLRSDNDESSILVSPKYGTFRVTVTTTGELQAKNSIEIKGPRDVQSIDIYQMSISRLVPEGTVVKTGDFVAELDKSQIITKLREVELSIQKYSSQYTLSQLDSTQKLAGARENLENLKFSLEEQKLVKEQSIYEAPAVIRKAEIDYLRAERAYNQSIQNYATQVKQAVANLSVAGADFSREKSRMENIMQVLNQFTINAPADGMVIYAREWNGQRKEVGSEVSAWDPVVAKLPDLTLMQSITYINEVDIQKVKKDQYVKISLDAIQNKKLTGKVVSVANIGEQKQNSDAKVFEVVIEVMQKDTTLRPAMTTSNEILIEEIKNCLYIPIEGLNTDKDSGKTYVFKDVNGKAVKQYVQIGATNDNEAVVKSGLSKTDKIYLNSPKLTTKE